MHAMHDLEPTIDSGGIYRDESGEGGDSSTTRKMEDNPNEIEVYHRLEMANRRFERANTSFWLAIRRIDQVNRQQREASHHFRETKRHVNEAIRRLQSPNADTSCDVIGSGADQDDNDGDEARQTNEPHDNTFPDFVRVDIHERIGDDLNDVQRLADVAEEQAEELEMLADGMKTFADSREAALIGTRQIIDGMENLLLDVELYGLTRIPGLSL
ncbi:hypothetical protein AX17_003773 [Amanita inopinata Kibby_2008]|nr:hypothetical protein AX17_003773 [Amanita inopinata Kibby_2008]